MKGACEECREMRGEVEEKKLCALVERREMVARAGTRESWKMAVEKYHRGVHRHEYVV